MHQVIAAIRYYVSYTACGVWHVPLIARDNMDVQVRNCLAGGASDIYADIVTVWVVILFYSGPRLRYCFRERALLLRSRFKP